MLARTAENLFWLARHIERAENTARILDVAHRSTLLPTLDLPGNEAHVWYAPLNITGVTRQYENQYGYVCAETVTHYMARDPDNSSSIYSSVRQARENARAVRDAITSEMWEVINATWLEIQQLPPRLSADHHSAFFDWVKERAYLFGGVTLSTILKDMALNFIRLGTFLERADNTARILDVKYHILLPSVNDVGGAADYYQWSALLKSVSAFEAYRKIYRDAITPLRVAELLILRDDMPRALHACLNEVEMALIRIDGASGREARRLAGELHAKLHFSQIHAVFAHGLHEYLTEFLNHTLLLGREIHQAYLGCRNTMPAAAIKPH